MAADLHLLEISDFQPLLNQIFYIQFSPEIRLEAELVEVTEICGYTPLQRKPFSFVLLTDNKMNYPQSTYILEHPIKGELPVFLVPIGAEEKGLKYEAVFA